MGRPDVWWPQAGRGGQTCAGEASTSALAPLGPSASSLGTSALAPLDASGALRHRRAGRAFQDDSADLAAGRAQPSPVARRNLKKQGILKARARLRIDADVPLPVPGGEEGPCRRAEALLSAAQAARALREDPRREGLASVVREAAASTTRPQESSLVQEARRVLQEQGLLQALASEAPGAEEGPVFREALTALGGALASVPQAVEAHAEDMVARGAWTDCVSLLTDASVTRTLGSSFLLACAYEALGAGATAARLLLEVACRGDVRAMLSLRRLTLDLHAVPGLCLPLTDSSAVASVTAMMKLPSEADLQVALRWFQRLEQGGTLWAKFALAGLHGTGVPQVLKPSMATLWKKMEEVASEGLAQAQYAMAWWYAEGLSPSALQYHEGDGEETMQHRQEATQEILLAKQLEAMCNYAKEQGFLLAGILPHPAEPRPAVVPFAKEWLVRAQEQGHAAASNLLGEWALAGVGGHKDPTMAEQMFRTAAAQSDSLGHLNLGILLKQQGGCDEEAVKHLLVAAEHGHADACYTVSCFYKDGVGIEKDKEASQRFLQQAAGMHHPAALHDLGVMYSEGTEGLPKHEDLALRCLKEASNLGHVASKYKLGMALRRRVGHSDTSRNLLLQAASAGSMEALHAKGLEAEQMHDYAEAVQLFCRAARLGHVDAMHKMGVLVASDEVMAEGPILDGKGKEIERSHCSACDWLLQAAKAGHHDAQYMLATYLDPGMMWDLDESVPKDAAKALKWYNKAAEAGNCLAQYRAGIMYQEGEYGLPVNYSRAADLFHMTSSKALAEIANKERNIGLSALTSPYSSARPLLARRKTGSKLVHRSESRSISFVNVKRGVSFSRRPPSPTDTLMLEQRQQLVDNHVDKAWYALGMLYQAGAGRAQNANEAVRYFRLASNLSGHVLATVSLGLCYQRGSGVNIDLYEGFHLFGVASEQAEDDIASLTECFTESSDLETLMGGGMAHTMVGACFRFGRGVFKDAQLAVRHFRRGVELGNKEAHCFLGDCFREGFGVAFNMQEAVKHYREAAETGSPRGHLLYGECLESGRGVDQDVKKAVEQYWQAANYGIKEAQYRIAWCHQKGRGVEKDDVVAFEWFQRSAKQDLAAAQYALAMCYLRGLGVQPDGYKACRLMKIAAKQGYGPAQLRIAPATVAHFFGHLVGRMCNNSNRSPSENTSDSSIKSGSSCEGFA